MTTITFTTLEVVLMFGFLVMTFLYYIEKGENRALMFKTRTMFAAIANKQVTVRWDRDNNLEFVPITKE